MDLSGFIRSKLDQFKQSVAGAGQSTFNAVGNIGNQALQATAPQNISNGFVQSLNPVLKIPQVQQTVQPFINQAASRVGNAAIQGVQSFNNLQNPTIPLASQIKSGQNIYSPQNIINRNVQGLKDVGNVTKAVGYATDPLAALGAGAFGAGMQGVTNLVAKKPVMQNLPEAFGQGMDFGAQVGPIGKVAALTPGLGKVEQGAAKLLPGGFGNISGNIGKAVAKEAITGAGYGALTAQNPLSTAVQFVPYGLTAGLSGKAEGKLQDQFAKLGFKDISPNVNKIKPEDINVMHEYVQAHMDNPKAEVIGDLGDNAQRIVEQYFGKKWATSDAPTIAKLFNAAIDLNAHLPRDVREPFPSMGLAARDQVGNTKSVNDSSYFHGSATEGRTELKVAKGNLGKGVYLTKNAGDARSYAAGWAGGVDPSAYNEVTPGQIYKVEPKSTNFFKTEETSLSPNKITKLKAKGYDGIETPNETLVFDPKNVSIKGTITPEEYKTTESVSSNPLPWETSEFQDAVKKAEEKKVGIPEYSQSDINFQGGQAAFNSENKPMVFQELFKKWIGEREAAKTTGTQTGEQFSHIPLNKAQEVIRARENPDFKTSEQVRQIASHLKDSFDRIREGAVKDGVDIGYLENYVTHYWEQDQKAVARNYQIFKQHEGFQNDRIFPTYDEGIKMGLKPKYDNPAEIISEYTKRAEQLRANLNFFHGLKSEGLVVDAPVGASTPGFVPIQAPGFPRSVSYGSDGTKIISNFYAPEEVANQINKIFSKEDMGTIGKVFKLTGKVSRTVQDVSLSGGLPGTPLNSFGIANLTKELTANILTPWKMTGKIANFMRAFSQDASIQYFADNAEQIKKMQKADIPISSVYEVKNLIDRGFIKNKFGSTAANIWGKQMNDPTFGRYLPMNLISMFNDIEKQALNGGRTEQEATNIAAQAVKNFYGEKGTTARALESKTGNNILSTIFFAPKYRDAMIRFWWNNVKALKDPLALENRQNVKFLTGAALTYGLMDYLNMKNNGHHMWQNPKGYEDKLMIPTHDDQKTVIAVPFLSSIATIPRAVTREGKYVVHGDISGAVKDAGQSYLSTTLKPVADVAANQNYFGKNIVDENDATGDKYRKMGQYLLNQYMLHPYLKEVTNPQNQGDPMYQRLSRAAELPLRFTDENAIDKSYYFQNKDEALKKLDSKEKAAFDAIPKQDPGDPLAKQYKYVTLRQYPAVYSALKETALAESQRTGVAPDPLYTVPYTTARMYMLYESQNPASQDKKDLYKAHPEIGQLAKARSEYFIKNPFPKQTSSSGGAPQPSAYVQSQMNAKNWSDPQVQAYLNANSSYNNQQRQELGLTPVGGGSGVSSSTAAYQKRTLRMMSKPHARKAPKLKLARRKGLKVGNIKKLALKPLRIANPKGKAIKVV